MDQEKEMRTFGYLCPACGKPVLQQRSRFALLAAAANMECECGKSSLRAETDGIKFRLWVPCGFCGKTHQAECSAENILEGRGIGLACPDTGRLCCYIGEELQVRRALEQLVIRAEKDNREEPEAFTDNIIMHEVLSELKDIAARGGISCSCGSKEYRIRVGRDAVDLICAQCGGRLRLPAATEEDLSDLCGHMKLEIRGR